MSPPLGRSMPLNFADRADCVSEEYILSLENSALTEMPNQQTPNADATFARPRATIDAITLGKTAFEKEISASNIQIRGNG